MTTTDQIGNVPEHVFRTIAVAADIDSIDNPQFRMVVEAAYIHGRASTRAERDRLAAQVAAAYRFADEMAGYCSPHGIAHTYANRLREALDRAAAA